MSLADIQGNEQADERHQAIALEAQRLARQFGGTVESHWNEAMQNVDRQRSAGRAPQPHPNLDPGWR